jgi:hypothetical protein
MDNKNSVSKEISKYVSGQLKKNFIKNMIMGSNLAYEMIYNKIVAGATLDDIKSFCVNMMGNKENIEKIVTKEKGEN